MASQPGTHGSSTSADSERVLAVKSSISGIGWKKHHDVLRDFVDIVHTTTFHAYAFAKYIFLKEHNKRNFKFENYIREDFFKQVWLSLIKRTEKGTTKEKTVRYRKFIKKHLKDYLKLTDYKPPELAYAQQSAGYEATKMYVAYTNNVRLRFGEFLRRAINKFFDVKEKLKDMRKEMLKDMKKELPEDVKADELRARTRAITDPAKEFKLAMVHRGGIEALAKKDRAFTRAFSKFKNVLNAYDKRYDFGKNGLYYDCKENPVKHFKAFFELARVFPRIRLKAFNCFPLRRSFSPCYVHIDTVILCHNILGRSYEDKKTEQQKEAEKKWTDEERKEALKKKKKKHWGQIVELNRRVFKDQKDGKLEFFYSIETDGVGVTVLKKGIEKVTEEEGAKSAKDPFPYISKLKADDHKAIDGKCVAVDPGRRNLLFCVHENSTVEEKRKYQYTKLHQDKMRRTKEYRRIRDDCKKGNQAVLDAEAALSKAQGNTVSLVNYKKYLKCRAQHSEVLTNFYKDTLTLPNTDPTTHSAQHPLFRKLKLSAYISKQQSDQKLIDDLREKFDRDAAFVMGNWSAPHTKYHEPIRGIGFRRLLKRHGFKVFLIDEHKTSKCCPACNNPTLEKFKPVANPRSKQHEDSHKIICHGLLRCTHQPCKEAMKDIKAKKKREGKLDVDYKEDPEFKRYDHRLWNRDMAACLNFIQIIRSVRKDKGIPTQFQRSAVSPPEPSTSAKHSLNEDQDQEGSKHQKTN
ncbi:hypothetical protein BDF22DRAFT_743303 [Syncephalis plumigaleata]|nr:hypothetical protein BDF22DRAFT_743303 [Syncephalis plumigaleata]